MTLETIDSGLVKIEGEKLYDIKESEKREPLSESQVSKIRSKVGMVFQSFNLFPHMTVLRNVTEAPVYVLRQSHKEAEQQAEKFWTW